METINLNVSNMKCGGCTSGVETGLKTIAGVENVTAILDGGKVTVTGENINLDDIRSKLDELGFPEKAQ